MQKPKASQQKTSSINYSNSFIVSNKALLFFTSMLLAASLSAQQTSGLFIPSDKPLNTKQLQKAWVNPKTFCLLLYFNQNDTTYRVEDLDLLDSAYRIAFNKECTQFYTMTIESYGSGDDGIGEARVNSIYQYFTQRGHEYVPVRYAYNPVHCSCHGDSLELIRYEVPTTRSSYNISDLPGSRRTINQTIQLENCVLITFRHNIEECIGLNGGCFLPQQDSNIRGYYTQILLPKGSIYSISGTRGECPTNLEINIDEHLDCQRIMEHFFLVPHRKQIILPVGYVVLSCNMARQPYECSETLPDSIFIRFPVTQEQIDSKLRIFAKVHTEKGTEYKQLATKKVKTAASLMIQAAINPSQFDTIFLAKRIQPDEANLYLYEASSPNEPGAVEIGKYIYVPTRINRKGNIEYRQSMRDLLRIIEESEETDPDKASRRNKHDNDEDLD